MTDLLTTQQVEGLLQVDRTTIYRMVQSGNLPGVRVGKQWRFRRADIDNLMQSQSSSAPVALALPANLATPPDAADLADLLPVACVQAMQDAFADALGVMIVITDMDGRPVSRVSNPCGLYEPLLVSPEAIIQCISNWQAMAGTLSLEPRYSPNDLGLLCARGLVRAGNQLKGMVMMGGIAPEVWPPTASELAEMAGHFGVDEAALQERVDQVYRVDAAGRERILSFVQRLADIISHIIDERYVLHTRLQAIASLTAL